MAENRSAPDVEEKLAQRTAETSIPPAEKLLSSLINCPVQLTTKDGRIYQGHIHCIDSQANIILNNSVYINSTQNLKGKQLQKHAYISLNEEIAEENLSHSEENHNSSDNKINQHNENHLNNDKNDNNNNSDSSANQDNSSGKALRIGQILVSPVQYDKIELLATKRTKAILAEFAPQS
jgi:small nuclear ribonucleoprotein (snRNP)-like protein